MESPVVVHPITVNDPNVFGLVWWSDADLIKALTNRGIKITDGMVEELRSFVEPSINDRMIERGWAVIESAIDDMDVA